MEIKDKGQIIGLRNPETGKMMKFKGHTTIELKDVVTGEVKKYEDDNMFTTAIGQMIAFAARHNYYNTWNPYTSHTYNLLGGLILFREAVNTSSLYPEAGNLPVGYGAIGDTNSYTGVSEWGIYNTQESDTSAATTKKMVWDFSTSHANGKISAVCLSHRNAGILGAGTPTWQNTGRALHMHIITGLAFHNSSKGRQGRNTNGYISKGSNLSLNDAGIGDFCLDSVNDIIYQFRVCSDGLGIIKHSTHPEVFDPFRDSRNWQSFTEETYAADFSNYGAYVYHFYNPDEKMLYFWMLGSNTESVNNGTTFKLHKFDVVNKMLTKDWQTMKLYCNHGSYNQYAYHTSLAVTNTEAYYIAMNASPSAGKTQMVMNRYQFAGDTTTNFNAYSYSSYNTQMLRSNNVWIINGRVYFPGILYRGENSRYYTWVFDPELEQGLYTNFEYYTYNDDSASKAGSIPPYDNTQCIWLSGVNAGETQYNSNTMNLQQYEADVTDFGNTYCKANYLGTINNLSEAITKTAQQTMKVTYTITAVELE